jgi:hypothetical protein
MESLSQTSHNLVTRYDLNSAAFNLGFALICHLLPQAFSTF